MKAKEQSGMGAVLKQTLIVALIGFVLALFAQFLYPAFARSGLFAYSPLRFILGGVYGWVLGVANFFAMALSLIMLTSGTADRQEGQKKAQAMYMGRLVTVLLFAVGGCFIPVFHPAAILFSLALTQAGISIYAMCFKLFEGRKEKEREEGGKKEAGSVPASTSNETSETENSSSEDAEDDKTEG